MGNLDKNFSNADKTRVFSSKGLLRYIKRLNAKGKRRYGQFSLRPEDRASSGLRKKQFWAKQTGKDARAD